MDPEQVGPLVQRLLTRMDHLEYGLLDQSNRQLQDLTGVVDNMRRARLLEQEDNLLADMLAAAPRAVPPAASHRGPGSEPPRPKPAPAPAPTPTPARAEEIVKKC